MVAANPLRGGDPHHSGQVPNLNSLGKRWLPRHNPVPNRSNSHSDEWANLHYGHVDLDNYERMVAISTANQQPLINARATLRERYNNAALRGNWEEAAKYVRAIEEVKAIDGYRIAVAKR